MYGSSELTWKANRLFVEGKRQPMAEVVRDARYSGMWRFRLLPGGELSDMVNLIRAKDAARSHVLSVLNKRRERPHVGAYIEPTPSPLPEPPPDA